MTPSEEERAAVVAWIANYAAGYERTAESLSRQINAEERAKCVTTSCAFRFIQHAIERGDHLSQDAGR